MSLFPQTGKTDCEPFSEFLRVGQAEVVGHAFSPDMGLTGMVFSMTRQVVRSTRTQKLKDIPTCIQVAFVVCEFIKEMAHATGL